MILIEKMNNNVDSAPFISSFWKYFSDMGRHANDEGDQGHMNRVPWGITLMSHLNIQGPQTRKAKLNW